VTAPAPGEGRPGGPQPSPGHVRAFVRQAATLALAGASGAAFDAAGVPLGWLIGAMVAVQAAAMAGAPVEVSKTPRNVMVAMLGVLLGSAFEPALLGDLHRWAVTLGSLPLYLAITTGLGIVYLRRVAGFDMVSAYFTATPGGFSEMTMVGSSLGGDERLMGLSHSARIMIVVASVPAWLQLLANGAAAGASAGAAAALAGIATPPLGLVDIVLLVACVAGVIPARRARVPAAWLLGPMLASAVIHLAGLTDSRPPPEAIWLAQVVVGAFIGSRFAGTPLRLVLRILALAAGLTAMLLVVTGIWAWALGQWTGLPMVDLILAFAPGGVSEMSLVALSLQADAAFVSTHHLVRIALIVVAAPLLFRLVARHFPTTVGPAGDPTRRNGPPADMS
jgi:membrane AbrB-like protein